VQSKKAPLSASNVASADNKTTLKLARAEMAHASAQNERKTDTETAFRTYHPPSFSTFYTYKSSKI
jgi:hypothetical protein